MCGIAGIVRKQNNPADNESIQLMLNAAVHRGVDGQGILQWNNATLGHRRLAIIDLNEEANQPMLFGEKYAIVYNGEVYNYIEIRETLQKLGYNFITRSDTEVILAAYDHWAEDCVSRFNGMWSMAILDKQKNILFCSRDRFGIKPFYFSRDAGGFYFGSEIRQILAVKPFREVEQNVFYNYLFTGLEEYGPHTFFSGIEKLPQSHNMVIDLNSGKIEFRKYYDLADIYLHDQNETGLIDKFRETLTESVKLRLRSDVRVGTCLSGGLDSSSIASIAAKLHAATGVSDLFVAIHGKSIEKATDESPYARRVADYCKLNLIISENNTGEFRDVLPKVIETQEEPFGSPSIVMQYFVMKKARESGVVVMLDGQGGDELLLGYERYYVSWLYNKHGFGKLRGFLLAAKNSGLNHLTLLQYYIYFTNFRLRLSRVRKRLGFIKPLYINKFDSTLLKDHVDDFRDFGSLQKKEIFKYQLPHLLKYEDKNSMAHSIEARLPFLDYKLVELSLSLPVDLKIRLGFTKYILRKSMEKNLPANILWRKNKFGFNAPVQTWLSDRNTIFRTLRESEIIRKMTGPEIPENIDLTILWRLYNIALWEKSFQMTLND